MSHPLEHFVNKSLGNLLATHSPLSHQVYQEPLLVILVEDLSQHLLRQHQLVPGPLDLTLPLDLLELDNVLPLSLLYD